MIEGRLSTTVGVKVTKGLPSGNSRRLTTFPDPCVMHNCLAHGHLAWKVALLTAHYTGLILSQYM